MTETLLIVDPDPVSQRAMVDALKAARYRTIVADGFGTAARLLESCRPDLLITAVRLGAFNGLHLVVLGRERDSRMSALVVDDRRDTVVEREALIAGATAYLARPVDADALLRKVAEALARRERRWWNRSPLAGNIEVGIGAGRARLLDIGYGGFRLESGTMHRHHELKLELPVLGLSVTAQRVWSCETQVRSVWCCGAALVAPSDSDSTQRWRRLVDTVRAGAAFRSSHSGH
jgi:DNA-binding response OmpR family regulator